MALFNQTAACIKGNPEARNEFQAVSAGLSALPGDPASKNATLALLDYPGSDLTGHRAHMLTRNDLDDAFLVLTMSRSHKQAILSMCPEVYQKVFTLKEYVYGVSGDIDDPYGGNLRQYKLCAQELAKTVGKLTEILKKS